MNISYGYFTHPTTNEMIAPGELYAVDADKPISVSGNTALKKGRGGKKRSAVNREYINKALHEDKIVEQQKLNAVKPKGKKNG